MRKFHKSLYSDEKLRMRDKKDFMKKFWISSTNCEVEISKEPENSDEEIVERDEFPELICLENIENVEIEKEKVGKPKKRRLENINDFFMTNGPDTLLAERERDGMRKKKVPSNFNCRWWEIHIDELVFYSHLDQVV